MKNTPIDAVSGGELLSCAQSKPFRVRQTKISSAHFLDQFSHFLPIVLVFTSHSESCANIAHFVAKVKILIESGAAIFFHACWQHSLDSNCIVYVAVPFPTEPNPIFRRFETTIKINLLISKLARKACIARQKVPRPPDAPVNGVDYGVEAAHATPLFSHPETFDEANENYWSSSHDRQIKQYPHIVVLSTLSLSLLNFLQ